MRNILFFILLIVSISSNAQSPFQNISLDQAFQKAKAESKFLFLQFEAADCNQCNNVAAKGLNNKELTVKLEQNFVCLKIDPNSPERSKIATSYNLNPQKNFGT